MARQQWNVLVTGGAGYVGSALVPKLLKAGHRVTVLDLYLFGEEPLAGVRGHPKLREVKGDLRDVAVVEATLRGCNAVIHLACISNDPSFELNPTLGKSINYDAFLPLVRSAKRADVRRFIYASSSSVYGVKADPEVTEASSLEPLTDYSKYKAMCETVLGNETAAGFVTCTIRPSTVCGYAPRQRLDVVVNILANHAINNHRIRVLGGTQKRPNIHIDDMVDVYLFLLQQQDDAINGKIYNVGYDNFTVMELAETVQRVIGMEIPIEVQPTDDLRSYHVSSQKIARELGFHAKRSVEHAVRDLMAAFKGGFLPNALTNSRYYNIKRMQEVNLR